MATRKKSRVKKTQPLEIEKKTDSENKKRLLQKPGVILLLIVVFFIFGSLIYKNKKLFVAGMVNNRPITSFELYSRLVAQSGKQMFDQIVVETLIVSEAKKKNIVISETDIDSEVSKIEKSLGANTTLNDALAQQGMTLKDLRDQVKMRLTAMKLVEDKISVSDEEVSKYMTENKDFLPKDEDEAKQKETVKETLKEQKVNAQIQTLLQELKSSAKITSFL